MDESWKEILEKYITDPEKLNAVMTEFESKLNENSHPIEEITESIYKYIPEYMSSVRKFLLEKEYMIDELDEEWTKEVAKAISGKAVIIYVLETDGVVAYGFENENELMEFINEQIADISASFATFIYVDQIEKQLVFQLEDKVEEENVETEENN